MKILHITPSYIPATRYGGTITAVHGLCKSLVRAQHEVHVYTTNVNGPHNSTVPLETSADLDGVKIRYFPSKFFRRLYYAPKLKRALIKRISEFDLIHLHSIYLWPTWITARMAKRYRVPYIVSPRGMLVQKLVKRKNRWIKSAWLRFMERPVLESASALHMTSEVEEREAKYFDFDFKRTFVVPNGIDMEPYETGETIGSALEPSIENNISGKGNLLLYLGRISWKKGLNRLITALPHLSDIHLVIAGNDDENHQPYLKKLAGQLKVLDKVTFTGPVYGKDKFTLLKKATLFVLPSYSENFANTVLEAMAVGCPVVITPDVGLADVVQRSGAGIISEGDPMILAEKIKDLLQMPDELHRKGQRGQQIVKDHFRWETIVRQMESAYEQAIVTGER